MARRRSPGRRPGRVRYSWHGFYLAVPQLPADVLNRVFILYDPLDDDHQEEVVHERTILHVSYRNPNETTDSEVGIGVYLARRDSAGAMVSDIDPLGVSAFDIESNYTLFNQIDMLRTKDVDAAAPTIEYTVNVKARRKIQDPSFLVVVVRVADASVIQFMFQARSLMREGRF